jgi:hypothetical protein
MADSLAELRGCPTSQIPEFNYEAYGYGKYGLASGVMLAVLVAWAYTGEDLLFPCAFVAFYLVEIQLLFLFPILVDDRDAPIRTSLALTKRVGYLTVLCNVIPIAVFMILGWLVRRRGLEAWLIGCMAILIWYERACSRNSDRAPE